MKIVLIGGTGFIGRHICEAFEKVKMGVTVISFQPDHQFLKKYAPLSSALEFGTEESFAALAQADIVLHFGYQSYPGSNISSEACEVDQNIRPTINLFSQLAQARPGVHIIYASTGGQIYGKGHTKPIPETATSQPITSYALGKHIIEEALRYYDRKNVLGVTILRIGNPVGHWQLGRRHGFVSAAVEAAILRQTLTLYGEGQNVRDYFDVRDLSDFVVNLVLRKEFPQGTYNIGSGSGMTEEEILSIVQRELRVNINLNHMPARSFDLPYAVLNINRARSELGWSPSYDLNETIRELSLWLKK